MDIEAVVVRLASVGNGWGIAWLWHALNGEAVPEKIVLDLKEVLADLADVVSPYVDKEKDE